ATHPHPNPALEGGVQERDGTMRNGHFHKPAAWANFAPAVLAVHWVRVPCLPNPSARTSPAPDGFEKFPNWPSEH
ncbi:MAG: hypothetical protein ACK45Y_11685, partial [Betaproteobacteria bacterium]